MLKLAVEVLAREGGAEQVNIAQAMDFLAALADIRRDQPELYESGLEAAYQASLGRAPEGPSAA